VDSPISGHPDTKAHPPAPSHLFPVPPGKKCGMGVQGVIKARAKYCGFDMHFWNCTMS